MMTQFTNPMAGLMGGFDLKSALLGILGGESELAQQHQQEKARHLPAEGSASYNALSPEAQAAIDRERERRREAARRQREEYLESVGGYGNYEGGFTDADYWNAGYASMDGAYYYGGEVYDGSGDPSQGYNYTGGAGADGVLGAGHAQGGFNGTGSGGMGDGEGGTNPYTPPNGGGTDGGGGTSGGGGGTGGGTSGGGESGGGNGTGHGGSNGCPAFHRWDEATGQCVDVYNTGFDMGTTTMTNRSSGFGGAYRNRRGGMMRADDTPPYITDQY